MAAMTPPSRSSVPGDPVRERLIDALVPAAIRVPRTPPVPLPVLPAPDIHGGDAGSALTLLEIARVDRSGRVAVRKLLRALRWRSGHRVAVDAVAGVLVVRSAADGRQRVSGRGELSLPAAPRALCGIAVDEPVVAVASLARDCVLVHPATVVVELLADLHAAVLGGSDAG